MSALRLSLFDGATEAGIPSRRTRRTKALRRAAAALSSSEHRRNEKYAVVHGPHQCKYISRPRCHSPIRLSSLFSPHILVVDSPGAQENLRMEGVYRSNITPVFERDSCLAALFGGLSNHNFCSLSYSRPCLFFLCVIPVDHV